MYYTLIKKKYTQENVFNATQKRLEFIFNEFDNIFVAFSGGKDSGLLLNLVIDYMKKHNITKKIGVFHQDFEAQYSHTTEYVERTLLSKENRKYIQPFWFAIPIKHFVVLHNFKSFGYLGMKRKRINGRENVLILIVL